MYQANLIAADTLGMHIYSENWRHLKSILAGYATRNRNPELYSYTDHTKAKALSIFLANAKLATPKLDRTTIEAVLAAKQRWPHSPGTPQFEGVSLPLSKLEEYGLVAFMLVGVPYTARP